MRYVFALALLASAISSTASAQLFQPGYPNTSQPAAVPAQSNDVVSPRYVAPPHTISARPSHYIVRQSAGPVTAQTPNAALPAAPWNSRGGGLFQGIFGGPTTTVRVFPSFAPGYSPAPQPNAPTVYTSINQGDAADHPIDPKYPGVEKPGTIIIDTPNKFLYLIEDGGEALRYGIGVGRPGFLWAGVKTITAKREWPDWRPPVEMIARQPDLPRFMPGGVDNPLGARALYLGSSLYRIHGSNQPWTIGTNVSSGCIRMRNEDVIDLYQRVKVGTKVVVI